MLQARALIALVLVPAVSAQAALLTFADHTWQIDARSARVERADDRELLLVDSGTVWLADTKLEDVVIEFDVSIPRAALGFGGVAFRAVGPDDFEEFYLRAHLSGQPDASQYQPVINGVGAWQIYGDANATAAVTLRHGGWMHVKLVVRGDVADVYVDSAEPLLHVPDLKRDAVAGTIGLRASGLPFRFSRFSARPVREDDPIVGEAAEATTLPGTLIRRWHVSDPFRESELTATLDLPGALPGSRTWTTLDVESNGIANLARVARRTGERDTVLARLVIDAEQAATRQFAFGYSDRVRIYLNGRLLFAGDAGWATRDYRFLGTVGRQDSVGLHLQPGRNELILAVSESFGGWAVTGDLDDRAGLSLRY